MHVTGNSRFKLSSRRPTQARPNLPAQLLQPQDSVSNLGDAETQELQEWTDRLRPELGKLSTPPTGKVDPALAAAQDYLETLVEELAGADLKKQGIDLHVEVFSGDVPQVALDDDMSLEEEWQDENPGKPWPVRGWLGAPKNGNKPIYRMAVNLGMLRALDSREELAFVVAQQAEQLLDHDRLDPDNESTLFPQNQSFIEPREMQAAADKAAVARLVEAGFNPKGALKALEKLYTVDAPDYPEDDLERGLIAYSHDQEHEGMRLGLVQAEVEKFVRIQDPATAKPLTPLPTELKIEGAAEYEKDLENPLPYQENYQSLAGQVAGSSTPAWMFRVGNKPAEVRAIRSADASSQDKEEALVAMVDQLEGSAGHSPQNKVDGFLRTLLALGASPMPEDAPYSEQAQEKISSFLAKNGPEWDAKSFLSSLNHPGPAPTRSLHKEFVRDVVFNETFQSVLGNSLPELIEAVPESWLKDRKSGESKLEELPDLVKRNHDDPRDLWPLSDAVDQATLKFIRRQDAQGLANKPGKHGAPFAMVLSNDLLTLKDLKPRFQAELRGATSAMVDASNAKREDQARLRMRPPLRDSQHLNGYLNELGESESWGAFSDGFNSEFPALLKDVALLGSQQPDLVFDESRPVRYPDGVEKRLAGLVESTSGSEQKAMLDHLSRHTEHYKRIPARSPRRAWLGKAARALAQQDTASLVGELSAPNLSQHSKLIQKTFLEGYGLTEKDLPDSTTPSLEALEARRAEGEFEPQPEDYANEEEYFKALDEYYERADKMHEVMGFVAAAESRLVLGRLALLGHDKELSEEVSSKLDLENFSKVLVGAEKAVSRSELLTRMTENEETEYVGADAGAFMMDGFLAVQESIEGVEQWHELATRSIDFSSGGLEARVGTRRKLADNLFPRLETLPVEQIHEWLGSDKVLDILSAAQTSDLLLQCLGDDCEPGTPPETLAKAVADLEEQYTLREEYPLAFNGLRDKVAEKAKLQPDNVDEVFPKVEPGVTETNSVYAEQARSLSGLLAVARERSPQEQINTVEYLMGRQKDMPAYLEEASESQGFAPLAEALQTTRQDLLDADANARVMVANSFLAGPSGIMRSKEGKEAVINHFLKGLKADNRELGEKIARAVLSSHGDADTLAVAFILGQKPEEPKDGEDPSKPTQLDEASILNRLFDAYGVPGIKMKQYLAFTSEFKDFKDAFESAQDSAMPLNYFQVLKLVQNRFGDEWPKDMQIDRVLGSGSVNVAIRYKNEASGKREVVSLGRQDIEESTAYDFDRFHKFINELTKTPEDKEKFGYVLGLLNLIEDSVALEFDKESAMAVQRQAKRTYKHEQNGWTVQSIDAYKVENLGLFMEEAKGRTARKTFTQKPEVYKEAMQAMAGAEFGVLKGQPTVNTLRPKPLFANPDFHDGQVMIDEETKSVTILDFGQAVPITNEERDGGLDILTIIGKAEQPESAARRLNKRYFGGEEVIGPADLEDILERTDRMDIFIHLLSTLNRKGAEVPLSTVHWVLGLNRQLALAEKIGKPIDKQVRNMVITHKLWLPLGLYNTAHWAKEKATAIAVGLADRLSGWIFGKNGPEDPPKTIESTKAPKLNIKGYAPTKVEEPAKAQQSSYVWRPNFSKN